jgi:hypothetical protein
MNTLGASCSIPDPDAMPVTAATFRRLPSAVRQWYRQRARHSGQKLLTELAARCLVNDCLESGTTHCGPRSVDGWNRGQAKACVARAA